MNRKAIYISEYIKKKSVMQRPAGLEKFILKTCEFWHSVSKFAESSARVNYLAADKIIKINEQTKQILTGTEQKSIVYNNNNYTQKCYFPNEGVGEELLDSLLNGYRNMPTARGI